MRLRTREGALLLAMLVLDTICLTLSLVHHYSTQLPHPGFSMAGPEAWGAYWQYAKQLLCAGLLASVALRCRLRLLALWSALFIAIFLIDAFQLNEKAAGWLVSAKLLPAALASFSQHQFSLMLTIVAGLGFVATIVVCHREQESASLRADSASLARLVGLYFVFQVIVAQFHHVLEIGSPALLTFFTVFEAWGAMLVMSLVVTGVYLAFVRTLREHPQHQVSMLGSPRSPL